MRIVRGHSFADIYRSLAEQVTYEPDHIVSPRGKTTAELEDVTLIHESPWKDTGCFEGIGRKTSLSYVSNELAWYLTGSNKVDRIAKHAKMWSQICEEDGTANSAYGHTIFTRGQWLRCAAQLVSDPDTRQAVITLHCPEWFSYDSKDVPCTLSLVFRTRKSQYGRKLDLVSTMRSNDMWYGLPFDAPFFMFLQDLMMKELRNHGLDVETGKWVHHAHSLHAYEEHWDKLARFSRHAVKTTEYPLFDYELTDAPGSMLDRIRGPLAERLWKTTTAY